MEHALAAVREGGCDPLFVVLGASADLVQSSASLEGATVLVNKAWSTGMASSLRAGLTAAEEAGAAAVVVVPVDMPLLSAEAVRLVAAESGPQALACGTYAGRRSYPVLLGREHFAGASTLASADVGVRPYLVARDGQVRYVACDEVAGDDDVDTPEDAARCGIEVPS